jgi:hypothetical protein
MSMTRFQDRLFAFAGALIAAALFVNAALPHLPLA